MTLLESLPPQPNLQPELAGYLNGISEQALRKMDPLIRNCSNIYEWANQVLTKNGLNSTKTRMILEMGSEKGEIPIDPNSAFKHELSAEYRHIVHHVMGTTLKLKKFMIDEKMPDRVIAYQTGTGFPLPLEIEGKVKKIASLKFGEGILEFIPKADNKRDDRPFENEQEKEEEEKNHSGLHFYEVTGANGGKMTLIAIKGRFHGYSAVTTKTAYTHHLLAILPRVLKGVVESMLTTFASGYDGVPIDDQKTPNTGDYGYILNVTDLSGESTITHPGKGIQTLLGPVFGGPYMPTTSHGSDKRKIKLFEKAIQNTFPEGNNNGQPIPQRHATLFFDGGSTPNFEHAVHWYQARSLAQGVINTPNMIDQNLLDEIPSRTISTNQGMSTLAEIDAYNQYFSQKNGGYPSIFNRKLPILAVTAFTDSIDPSTGGQSHHISDEAVREAGQRGAAFIAPVISEYASLLADIPPVPKLIFELENYLKTLQSDLELQFMIADLQGLLINREIYDLTPSQYYELMLDLRDFYLEEYENKGNPQFLDKADRTEQAAKRVADYIEIDHEDAFVLN